MNIYEVAEKAGVSAATVSRVLNNSGLVSDKTEKRVLKVMDELNYRPNIFAKGLTTNSMQTIGVLTTNIRDDYFSTAIQAIVRFAQAKDYDILLSHTEDNLEDKKKSFQLLLDKRVDGIILIGSVFQEVKDNSHILNVAKQVPVVTLNAQIIGENVYSVYCDDARGMYDAAAYLLNHGRKRVAYIYDVETFSAHNKQNGYMQAVEAFQVEPICMQCQSGLSGGMEAAYKLLDTYPDIDGILCSEDMLAAGVLKALRKRQIAIPDQVAVVGYNDILFPECTNPELASVDGKVRILSEYAFDCMYRVLEDGIGPQSIVISPHFIVRESAMLD